MPAQFTMQKKVPADGCTPGHQPGFLDCIISIQAIILPSGRKLPFKPNFVGSPKKPTP
jgi:hypothetical protein